ncbi:hypothetical protein UFOVP163_27 [uncultured Caudovirales phage]|uniref:Uncharacterized protein n=1 Tax=uncultured Caudovirales phage TaxID=2100421 RepID=A0A6J7W9Q7_9CAUD|nr:hypothetical protein UFOVP163_27 [uncultured Caudovirales phage]
METQVKVRVYNIDYEVYRNYQTETEEEFDEYMEELQQDIIVEIDPEDINWNMEFITEYITDYISDITGETHNGYEYEVLVDLREVKLNLLGI